MFLIVSLSFTGLSDNLKLTSSLTRFISLFELKLKYLKLLFKPMFLINDLFFDIIH